MTADLSTKRNRSASPVDESRSEGVAITEYARLEILRPDDSRSADADRGRSGVTRPDPGDHQPGRVAAVRRQSSSQSDHAAECEPAVRVVANGAPRSR